MRKETVARYVGFSLIFLHLAMGCFAVAPEHEKPQAIQKDYVTPAMVSLHCVDNKSTKLEVLQAFGDPEQTSTTLEGLEQFTYIRISGARSERTMSGAAGIAGCMPGVFGGAGAAGGYGKGAEESVKKAVLRVVFDKNNVVKEHSYSVVEM
jgi:hypothetical protein